MNWNGEASISLTWNEELPPVMAKEYVERAIDEHSMRAAIRR
jgi:hypothetical protein